MTTQGLDGLDSTTPARLRLRAGRIAELLLPLAISVGVLATLGFDPVFRSTPPAGSDLTGHLVPIDLLHRELLSGGRLQGWSHDWFAGFPVYFFYFPLPGLVGALLASLVAPAVALRVVALAPALAFPWVLAFVARSTGLRRSARLGIVLVGSSFLFSTGYTGLGGNLISTLGGEFSYLWGLDFAILYLAVLGRSHPRSQDGTVAGLLLGASVLCHVLPAMAVAAAVSVLGPIAGRGRATLRSFVVAAVATAFWTLPLAAHLGLTKDPAWGFVPDASRAVPMEVLVLLPAAMLGVASSRRRLPLSFLLAAGVVGLGAAYVPASLYRGRLLPLWYLAVYVLAGVGVAEALRMGRRLRPWRAALLLLVAVAPWPLLVLSRGIEPIRFASDAVLGGLESRPGAEEVEELVAALSGLPAGRVHWEGTDLSRWGGPHIAELLPHWTHHTVLGGLLAESSPMSRVADRVDAWIASDPPAKLFAPEPSEPVVRDPARGVSALRMLGVQYLVTASRRTAADVGAMSGVRLMHAVGDLALFDLGPAPLVVPLECGWGTAPPSVSFQQASDAWLSSWDGPRPWLLAPDAPAPPPSSACRPGAVGGTVEVEVEPHRIRFRTPSPGVPHLLRVSYFPSWRAEGGRGPYLAAPWFMVVVPDRADVVLHFRRSWAELAGLIVTSVGLLALLVPRMLPARPRSDRMPTLRHHPGETP